jgi:mRNA interferase MazF
MAMKQPGQVVIFKFPQTNLEYTKARPALLLAKVPGDYDDWLICMVSSKLHQYIEGLDEIINPDSPDFQQSGLRTGSVIRVTRIAVVAGDILMGTIGEISPERLRKIRNNLSQWIRTGSLPGQEASNNDIEDETILSTSIEESDDRPEPQEGDKDDE